MNQQQNQCGHQIHHIMQKQAELVSEYIDYLDNIKLAVTANDNHQLNELLSTQQLNPELIEQTQQQQNKILTDNGFKNTDSGLDACIQSCENSEQLLTLKKQLKDKLEALEKSLLVNALLVQKNQQRVRQSVRILSGHDTANTSTTYSRQGDTNSIEENSRPLARA